MNNYIGYLQILPKDETKDGPTHHLRIIKEVSEKEYERIAELNREMVRFEKKKDAGKILFKKSKALFDQIDNIKRRTAAGEHISRSELEIDVIDALCGLSNAYHSLWKTSEANIKRAYGRKSQELVEFEALKSFATPFSAVFTAVRHITNHSGVPKLYIAQRASVAEGEILEIFLDVAYLIKQNPRKESLVQELSVLDDRVDVLDFFNNWKPMYIELLDQILALQSREFLNAATDLVAECAEHLLPKEAQPVLVQMDPNVFSDDVQQKRFNQTIVDVQTAIEVVNANI